MNSLRVVAAMWKAGLLTSLSYRLRFALSLASVVVTVVPLFFISSALQPMMGTAIAGEGERYFDFLMLGFVAVTLITVSTTTLPNQVGADIQNGFFETLTGTPAGIPAVLVGLASYPVFFALLKSSVVILAALALGMHLTVSRLPHAALIIGLVVVTHVGIGLMATASMIVFRSTMAIPELLISGSALLGGVYWPTAVIPSWIQRISDFLPLSYGLRALRKTALEGASLGAVRDDMIALVAFGVFCVAVGALAMTAAIAHARKRGSLSYY